MEVEERRRKKENEKVVINIDQEEKWKCEKHAIIETIKEEIRDEARAEGRAEEKKKTAKKMKKKWHCSCFDNKNNGFNKRTSNGIIKK